jgi:hypothetical protein
MSFSTTTRRWEKAREKRSFTIVYFLSNIENQVMRPRQSSIALPVKIPNCFGVLEYWSFGVLEKAKHRIQFQSVLSLLHYSTTPSLQQTAATRERPFKTPQEHSQAGSYRLGYFIFAKHKKGLVFFFIYLYPTCITIAA